MSTRRPVDLTAEVGSRRCCRWRVPVQTLLSSDGLVGAPRSGSLD